MENWKTKAMRQIKSRFDLDPSMNCKIEFFEKDEKIETTIISDNEESYPVQFTLTFNVKENRYFGDTFIVEDIVLNIANKVELNVGFDLELDLTDALEKMEERIGEINQFFIA